MLKQNIYKVEKPESVVAASYFLEEQEDYNIKQWERTP